MRIFQRLLPALVLALSGCPLGGSGGSTTGGNGVCGSVHSSCTSDASCCSGFVCVLGTCNFNGGGPGGGNSNGGGSSGGSSGGTTHGTTGGSSGGSTGGSCAVLGISCASEGCCTGLSCTNGVCVLPSTGNCSPACNFGESCTAGSCVCNPSCTGNYGCNGADRCVQGGCVAGGGSCSAFSECCSGDCSQNSCTSCSQAGDPCVGTSGCCTGLTCYNDVCGSCQGDDTSCTLAGQCCSDNCDNGSCKACGAAQAACTQASDCCSNSCGNLEGQKVCCEANGSACTAPEDCCGLQCTDGLCATICADTGEPCLAGTVDCCSGTCTNGVCATTCVANGTTCTSDASCCSGSCVNGTCGVACQVGSACSTTTACCADLTCAMTSATAGLCELPGEFGSCSPTVGCSQTPWPLQCLGTSGSQLCVQTCTQSSGCDDDSTTCQAGSTIGATGNVCLSDFCGPGSSPANGTAYFGPCTNLVTNDGFCLPISGSSQPGICVQQGTAAPGQVCDITRSTDLTTQCGSSSSCFPGSTTAICLAICATGAPNAPDGGPSCASPYQCVTGPFAGNSTLGFCLEPCTAGTTVCPANTACQSNGLCLPN